MAVHLEDLLTALEAEPDPPTTVRARDEARRTHLADSLAGLEIDALREAGRIADLGAGAGFPGLPLAIALPHARVDLIESTEKKCEVIRRLAAAAEARNATAVYARAEEWAAGDGREAYDAVTARALAALPVLVEYAAPLLVEGGILVAWKGRRDEAEEEAGARAAGQLGMSTQEVRQAGPFEHHYLHVYGKTDRTPPRFPRRPGMASKRPLA